MHLKKESHYFWIGVYIEYWVVKNNLEYSAVDSGHVHSSDLELTKYHVSRTRCIYTRTHNYTAPSTKNLLDMDSSRLLFADWISNDFARS